MLKRSLIAALCGVLTLGSPLAVNAKDATPAEGADPDGLIIEDEITDAVGITVDYHSIEDIKKYVADNGPQYLANAYAEAPDYTTAPYAAGKLTDEVQNDALKAVNTIRYIAGLDYQVKLDDSCKEMVQAGALLNAINDELSHFPEKPAGIDDGLYQLGYRGCSSANIAWNIPTLAGAVTAGWLNDGDASNIDVIGHRRWLLNAAMGKTGFGAVGAYSGMYAYDTSGSNKKTSNVWPAQNTPVEFFGTEYPWSVSTGRAEDISTVYVVMTNNKTKVATKYSATSTSGYFNIDNDVYGTSGAIIWRPENVTYAPGDSYDITIFNCVNGEISYTVNFFQLYEDESMSVSPSSLEVGVGETATITASFVPASSTDYVSSMHSSYNSSPASFEAAFGEARNTVEVTGLAEGSGTITLTSANGLSAEVEVNVVKRSIPAAGITVNPTSLNLTAGETAAITATVTPDNADDKTVTWSTSDNSVVTVDNGTVTAVGAGTATITASTVNGLTATCEVTVEKKPISIYGSSLALEGKIGINFYLNIAEEDLNDLTVVMQMGEKEDVRVPASEGLASTVLGQKLRMFVYPVAAKEMRDKVTLTVENKSGDKVKLTKDETDYTEGYPFSASDYFAKAETAGQERTKKLARVLNNYGKYAQIYFNYNTDEVTDLTDVSAVTLETLAPYQVVQTENPVAGLTYVGGTTMLDDAIGYRLYFKIDTSHQISDYTFKMDGKVVTPVKSGSQYYIEKTDIAAKDLGVKNKIEVTDGTNTFGIQYCALSYAYRALELTAEDKIPLQNMCRAMYLYNQQAIEYFNTK